MLKIFGLRSEPEGNSTTVFWGECYRISARVDRRGEYFKQLYTVNSSIRRVQTDGKQVLDAALPFNFS